MHDEKPLNTIPEKPDNYQALLDMMTPELHSRFKTAIELGKWENGERLTSQQMENCMQAVIAYDLQHLPETERVAYIDRRKLQTSNCDDNTEQN